MKFQEALEKIAADFTRFWNVWDIERLCGMMSENAILESPMIKKVYPEHTSLQIKGREEIRRYWIHLRNITGGFEVNQISVHKKDKEITTVNKIIGSDVVILETLNLNEYAKITYLKYEYVLE